MRRSRWLGVLPPPGVHVHCASEHTIWPPTRSSHPERIILSGERFQPAATIQGICKDRSRQPSFLKRATLESRNPMPEWP
eukprot:9246949-Pyramimonas_sp.AAC.1